MLVLPYLQIAVFHLSCCEGMIYLKFFRDEIGVLEQVSGTSVTALIHQQIQHHVETTCKGNFETAYLENLETVSVRNCNYLAMKHDWVFQNLVSLTKSLVRDYLHHTELTHKINSINIFC